MSVYSYACAEFPGMEECPARFRASTEAELWQHLELHAQLAHGEDVRSWPPDIVEQVRSLVKTELLAA
jgi:predicted small metal-binding protein